MTGGLGAGGRGADGAGIRTQPLKTRRPARSPPDPAYLKMARMQAFMRAVSRNRSGKDKRKEVQIRRPDAAGTLYNPYRVA